MGAQVRAESKHDAWLRKLFRIGILLLNKRILVINWRDIHNPEAGGAEIYYHEIFRRIALRNFDVTVLAHSFPGAAQEEMIDTTRVIRHGNKFLFNYNIVTWLLRNQDKFDLIIEDLNKIPFLTPIYLKKPLIHLVMHFFKTSIYRETNPLFATYVYLMEKMVSLFYKNERFIAISESTKAEICDFGIPAEHIEVVEPGIDSTFYHQTMPKATPVVLAYVGRLMKYKNIQFLIRALPELQKRVPGVVLEIGGSGDYLEELRRVARKHGVFDSVRFLGRISEEQKRDLLSRATLFVNASKKEGWGINTIEANLCKTISLSNDVPGLRDSVQDRVTGLLYRPDDIEDFCTKAALVLLDKKYRQELEQKAFQRAQQLDWDHIADKMYRILSRLPSMQ